MEREMMAWFPGKVQALLIDDDERFRIPPSAKMLSLLNFKVSIYKSPAYALNRVLTGDKAKDVDVVFINTKKALSCGFDFRGVVQAQLSIPVVYLLPQHHGAIASDQVDKMLRTLQPGTYTIGMPLDVEDVLRIWRSIAWSKCCLKKKEARRNREKEDQERIHFEQQQQLRQYVMQSVCNALGMPMPPYNPGMFPNNGAGPSNNLAAGGNTAGPSSLPVYPPPCPVYSAPVPAPPPPPPPKVNPSLVPAQGSRAPVIPGLFAPPRRGSGMRRRGNSGPIMLNFEHPQAGDLFNGMACAGALAVGHVGACSYVASSLHHSLNPSTVDHNELPAMVTMHTRSNNPPPMDPHPQQHVGVGSNVPTLYNNYYYNNAGSVAAAQQAGHGVAANQAAAAMEALGSNNNYTNYNNAASLVAPQDDVPAYDLAAFEAKLNSDNFSNYTDGSHMAPPDQVLAMASNLNELITMAGGAFGSDVAASSSMAQLDQDLVVAAAPNANQIPPGALGNDIDALLMGPQGPAAAMDKNNNDGLELEAMFPAEQSEENLLAQLQELLAGLDDAPTYEAGIGQDSQMGGATIGAATATATDAAATSLIGGESSMGIWDIDAENFEMVDDFVPNGTGDFMFRMM